VRRAQEKLGIIIFCSFSTRGAGRFYGNEKSNPRVGVSQNYKSIEEEKIEVIVPRKILTTVIEKVKAAHPYE
jgi:hypothetical protein